MQITESMLGKLVDVSVEAGNAILRYYGREFSTTSKDDLSPLTEADMAAHHYIVDALHKLAPDIPVISEESGIPDYSERKKWHTFFLVDPLDGTKEFINRNGEFTVNIALIEGNAPVLGVVHIPATGTTYYGGRGFGAFKVTGTQTTGTQTTGTQTTGTQTTDNKVTGNQTTGNKMTGNQTTGTQTTDNKVTGNQSAGNKITGNKMTGNQTTSNEMTGNIGAVPISHYPYDKSRPATIAVSRSHGSDRTETVLRDHGVEIGSRIVSGSSVKFCLVADGTADLYPRLGPTMEWDTAAGDCIYRYSAAGKPADSGLVYNKENLKNDEFILGLDAV